MRRLLGTLGPTMIAAGLVALSPAAAAAADTQLSLSGVSVACQGAYRAMRACLQKTIDAGAPESIRPAWEKQIADSITMWRQFRGQPAVENSCRTIAANPTCKE